MSVADNANFRIRKVTAATGVISTVAGNAAAASAGEGGLATDADIQTRWRGGGQRGNLYIAARSHPQGDGGDRIINTVADGGAAMGAWPSTRIVGAIGVALDASDNIYIVDQICRASAR
jgi:hypothetical protein